MSSSATAAVDASSPKPAANTPRRRKASCSSALRSSWLHAIVSSRLRWRALMVGSSLRRSVGCRPNRARISAGASTSQRAAASSIASGRRSRSRQSSTTVDRSDVVGRAREARSIAEQLHGGIVRGERRQPPDPLTSQAERFTAGRHDLHARTGAQELVDVSGDADGEVLAVVHDHQGAAIPEMLQHRRQCVPLGMLRTRPPRRRRSGRRAPGR